MLARRNAVAKFFLQLISIGWGGPDDAETIEHEANPEPSNKD